MLILALRSCNFSTNGKLLLDVQLYCDILIFKHCAAISTLVLVYLSALQCENKRWLVLLKFVNKLMLLLNYIINDNSNRHHCNIVSLCYHFIA